MKSLTKAERNRLIQSARRARSRAYSPYSGYQVGAAVLASDGSVYLGCNVENVSYGATSCAEQVAVYGAVAAGRKKFLAIAVTASDKKRPVPCGICRQILWELAGDLPIILVEKDKTETLRLSELYPQPFQKQGKK